MHRLAIARLARMSAAMKAETEGVVLEVKSEAEAAEEDRLYIAQHLRGYTPTKMAVLAHEPDFLSDTAVIQDAKTGLRSLERGGQEHGGGWWKEVWTETAKGQFTLEGENSQGHKWGEVSTKSDAEV